MVSYEKPQSFKIPLKNCQGTVLDHNLVTLRLGVEWHDKCGDNPNLVIEITNKQPSTVYQSSAPINSNHPHPQENVGLTYQQQYHHPSAINNHDLSSSTIANTLGDFNDFLSTTTSTLVYNSMPAQSQALTSSTAIQQIKKQLKSGLSPYIQHELMLNPQCLSSQHVIQTPSNNMNDSRLDMIMSTISPPSSINSLLSMTTQFIDLQQPSTLKPSPCKSRVCTCPNPTSSHVSNCAIYTSNNQESNTNLLSEPLHKSPINRTNPQQHVSVSHIPTNGANLLPSMNEATITTTFRPFSNSNFMNTLDSSSSVTTIISQPPSFLNNPQIGQTIMSPSLDTNNSFQQPSVNFPQVIIDNQSNYQTNPSTPMSIAGQQSTVPNNSRQQKTSPMKRNSLTNQDKISFQNLNNSQQQIHFLNNQNSPINQQNIYSPHPLSSPIQTPQRMFIVQDNSHITDNPLCGSTNDIVLNTVQKQQSPRTTSMVRSPVKLEISEPQHLNQSNISPEAAMEQTISEVVKGKGDISIHSSSTPVAQKQQRPSLSAQLVWESNGPTPTTRTFCSPLHQEPQVSTTYGSDISTLSCEHVADIRQQVSRPNFTEQSKVNILSQQPPTKNNKKRDRSKPTNNTASKRNYKPTVKKKQQVIISPSHQDISQTRKSPVTSISNVMKKPMSWPNTPISSSSSGSSTTAPIENLNQHLINGSLEMPDIGNDNGMLNYSDFNEEHIEIICRNDHSGIELDDLYSLKLDKPFASSTPPPISSEIMSTLDINQINEPPFAEKLLNTSKGSITNPIDIYENYLQPNTLSSSVTWEENQVSSSAVTPPGVQNNSVPPQQHYSPTNTYTDSNLQSQTLTSQSTETNSNTINQMNHNDDVQTPLKQQQQQQQKTKSYGKTNNKSLKHPSKISKQRNRSHPIQKQTSTQPTCTRCGLKKLIDITHHEFPTQKGLVFECVSCGNNSIRSNVSADEQRRRLAKVAADHLHTVQCQFCRKLFHSHNDYLIHLKDDHGSNKPM